MTINVVNTEHLEMQYVPATGVWQVCAKIGCSAYIVYCLDVEEQWKNIFPGSTKKSDVDGLNGNTLEFDFGVGDALTPEQCYLFLSALEADCDHW